MNKTNGICQDFRTGRLTGCGVVETVRTLANLEGVFRDESAWRKLDPSTVVYRVQSHQPVDSGVEGGLFWGSTQLEPGIVGDEYFQTRGHLHSQRDRGEFYVTVAGRGALILMSEQRVSHVEWMTPGSVHYIAGHVAHRVANIGDEVLSMIACWPSDAGHDYKSIAQAGFSGHVCRVDGEARFILGS